MSAAVRQGYETRMVVVTSLMVGFVAFDRLAIGCLSPYLVQALQLNNTQVGALYAVQAGAAALFGYAAGSVSDRTGWQKQIIVPLLVCMATFSLLSSFAAGFVSLVAVRALAGASEGPISTVSQAIVNGQSSAHRRGLNMGVVTLVMFLLAQTMGPLVLIGLAERWGWAAGLMAPAAPALMLALAAALVLRPGSAEPERSTAAVAAGAQVAAPGAGRRNVWVCALISMIFMGWLVVQGAFLPLYLVQVRGLPPGQMGLLLSGLGIAGCIGGLAYPALSDRIGRR